ncbi:MAG: hypothetical protein LAT76_13260 [Schleiferiaceae bacterium]|nr:hypothetical protein [Schleiferiaceae bacterium]
MAKDGFFTGANQLFVKTQNPRQVNVWQKVAFRRELNDAIKGFLMDLL